MQETDTPGPLMHYKMVSSVGRRVVW